MTDGQSLLLLFAALYFIECLRWLPPRSHLLIGSGTHWRCQRPFVPVRLAGASPALLSFLPPLQAYLPTLPWQLIPAAEGLELYLDERRPLLLPWSDVLPRVDGRTLHLGAGQRLRCLSEGHASQAQQQVQRWLGMSAGEREADFLQYGQETLQVESIATQAAGLTRRTRLLRPMGGLIFVWTFLAIVVLYRWLGEGLVVLWAAAALGLLQFIQAFLFIRRSREVPYRWWKTLAVALLPQHAMRAADLLCHPDTVPAPHPLAARKLLGEEAWQKLVRSFWKRARYQPGSTGGLQCRILEAFLEEQGVPVAELETAPQQEADSASYCPSCHAQFQPGATVCRDCEGVALRAF